MDSDALRYDDDSVPSDFFDDFSNQDFMAGLDVVDIWDEDGKTTLELTENGSKPSKDTNRNKNKSGRSRSDHVQQKKYKEGEDRLKRDPEKTKRDILRDKYKWTKNNEAKILSEKLKVVETGLVPPGTEMDYDTRLPLIVSDLREKLTRKKSSSPSINKNTHLNKYNRISPIRHRFGRKRSRSDSRSRISPHRYSPTRKHSNSISSARRRISSRSRSLERHQRYRGISPRRHLRRRSRSRSPRRNYQRRHSKSPHSTSDRQRNSKDFLEELADKLKYDEKKKKMLQEISHTLNEPVISNPHNMYRPGPSVQIPATLGPVMAPGHITSFSTQNNFFPTQTVAPQYDQEFFIGRQQFSNSNVFPSISFENSSPGMPRSEVPANQINTNLKELQKEQDQKAANKLLEDKNISLSDFLSMSAKYNASNTSSNIHRKVKVLALCQDAIKALENSSKLNGRFFHINRNLEVEKPIAMKGLSPLRKIPVTRFYFTTPWRGVGDKQKTQSSINKLMATLGFSFQCAVDEVASGAASTCTNPNSAYASKVLTSQTSLNQPVATVRFQNKNIQTDSTNCDICEARKSIKYTDQSTQHAARAVDCATQITDDDLYRLGIKTSMVGVTKSLAHLTPAQLLGKDDLALRRDMYVSGEHNTWDYSARSATQLQTGSRLNTLVDQRKLPMKSFEPSMVGKQCVSRQSIETTNRISPVERDPRIPTYNRTLDIRDQTFNQQRLISEENMMLNQRIVSEERYRMLRHEEYLRMQQMEINQPGYNIPGGHNNVPQNLASRKFY